MTVDQIRRRFCHAGWDLVNAEPASVETPVVRGADQRFELWRYELRRASR